MIVYKCVFSDSRVRILKHHKFNIEIDQVIALVENNLSLLPSVKCMSLMYYCLLRIFVLPIFI